MSILKIIIKLRGDKIASGAIDILHLVTLSDKFQKTLQSLAYSLASEKQENPEKKNIESKTALSLTGISIGKYRTVFRANRIANARNVRGQFVRRYNG